MNGRGRGRGIVGEGGKGVSMTPAERGSEDSRDDPDSR